MLKITDIQSVLDQWAPASLAASWDCIGPQLSDPSADIHEIVVSLEVDEEVLAYLSERTQCCVVTHHPLFFKPLRSVRWDHDMGKILTVFARGRHQCITAHTNLDAAPGGVNDVFVQQYGYTPREGCAIHEGFGKWFRCSDRPFETVLHTPLKANHRGYQGVEPIRNIGFCAGSGHGLMPQVVLLGLDTFVTGEATYHDEVLCKMNGIRLLCVGHQESEVLSCPIIAQRLTEVLQPSCPVTVLAGSGA